MQFRSTEIIQSVRQKAKRMRKCEQSLKDVWDIIKCANMHIREYHKEEKKGRNNGQNLPNSLKNFPKCIINLQSQEAQQGSSLMV